MDFVNILLAWYKKNQRDFPWRNTDNTFHVLLAELFLQQTSSVHVEKIYSKFINDFSTCEDIISAEKKELMQYLSKLGLQNKRYKVLLNICNNKGACKEGFYTKNNLEKIKGLGEYIINATLCFGEGERLIIYDTNTSRVAGRYFGISNKKDIKYKLGTLLPQKGYVNFNYALLDFGALLCKAQNPKCDKCPMNEKCKYNSDK